MRESSTPHSAERQNEIRRSQTSSLYTRTKKSAKINVAEEIKIVPRLLDVGHHLARAAGCARRPEAFAAPHPLRDARPRRSSRTASTSSARRSCGDTMRQLPPARRSRRSTRRSSTWRSRGRCARRSSMGRATSARVEGDPPASMRYTEARLHASRRRAHGRHGQGHGRFRPELRRDARPSRPSSPPRSRTCSSTAAPASRSAWRRTSRRTISAK